MVAQNLHRSAFQNFEPDVCHRAHRKPAWRRRARKARQVTATSRDAERRYLRPSGHIPEAHCLIVGTGGQAYRRRGENERPVTPVPCGRSESQTCLASEAFQSRIEGFSAGSPAAFPEWAKPATIAAPASRPSGQPPIRRGAEAELLVDRQATASFGAIRRKRQAVDFSRPSASGPATALALSMAAAGPVDFATLGRNHHQAGAGSSSISQSSAFYRDYPPRTELPGARPRDIGGREAMTAL